MKISSVIITSKKQLANINGNIKGIFLSIYYSEIYWHNFSSLYTSVNTDEIFPLAYYDETSLQNFPSLYMLVNTNESIPSLYTEGTIVGKKNKKTKKYDDV